MINKVIEFALANKCSDIHFGSNERMAVRGDSGVYFLDELGLISKELAEEIIFKLIGDSERIKRYLEEKEFDFSYVHATGDTFRCNAFHKKGNVSVAMRHIAHNIPGLDLIGAPEKLKEMILAKQGLILVCGPTGHGKTTTAYAMLEEINKLRNDHIITLEDPIEYNLQSKKCIVSQRQISSDTHSFATSLRAAMRQDPDVIMVGEMRDRETIEAVFNLCATGHLVISTIHANSASQTLARIVQVFPQAQREFILNQMADALLGILNQRLVVRKDGDSIAMFELMLANYAVKNSIRNGDILQMDNTIATSVLREGMTTLRHSAEKLIRMGIIDIEAARPYIPEWQENNGF